MAEQASAVEVAKGTSYLWIQTIVSTVIGAVAFAFVARLISTSQMGLLAILSLILSLAQLIAPLALPTAVSRFVAEELAQGNRRKAAAIFYQSAGISFSISAAMAATCSLFAPNISAALSTEPILLQVLAVDILISAGPNQILANALVGAQRFRDYSAISIAQGTVRQGLIIIMLLLFHELWSLICAWVISDLLFLLMMTVAVVRVLGPPSPEFDPRRLLGFSLPLIPGNSINFAYNWYDRALLVPYVPLTQLGVYNVTLTAFSVLSAIPGGIATVLYPAYAQIQSVKGQPGLRDAIHVASRYVSFISIPLALGLLVTAKPALSLFGGGPYEQGSAALQIISFFFALTVPGSAFGSAFLVLGKTTTVSFVTTISVAVSLIAALALLPVAGINGASVSRGLGMLTSFGLTFLLLKRSMGLSFDREAFWKGFAASIGMVAVVWLVQCAVYDRLLLPAYVILGGSVYMAGLRLLNAIHQADLELVEQFLGKRYSKVVRLLGLVLTKESQDPSPRLLGP